MGHDIDLNVRKLHIIKSFLKCICYNHSYQLYKHVTFYRDPRANIKQWQSW